MRVLLTGFEPFGGSAVNPSEKVVRRLARRPPAGLAIRAVVLPVAGGEAVGALAAAMDKFDPDAVVCLGESSRATGLLFERVAINLRDYRIPDNRGASVCDQPVVEGGPVAYFSTLPVRLMAAAAESVGVPATLSLSAGTFLCNEVMYALLHAVHARPRLMPAGFIHVPQLPEQTTGLRDRASMDTPTVERGLRAALGVLVAAPAPPRATRRRRPSRSCRPPWS